MRARDDLVAAFSRTMPGRVAEATELWLGVEQGKTEELATLRRLLHTVKGEAHMLEISQCGELAELAETVVDALRRAGEPTPLTGDALLGAFEAMGLVSSVSSEQDERTDLGPVLSTLRAAIEELEATANALEGRPSRRPLAPPPPVPEAVPHDSARPSMLPARPAIDTLAAEDVRPLVHELKRLNAEQAVFHERLRETQRMLRALLVEIDPHLSVEQLAERITKTLGYGLEIERRFSAVRAEWSANEFAVGLALDELDDTVRRASVVSTDQVLNQVRRVGRSTARTLDKDIELSVRGDAILDAGVAQRLEPALLHLVRNAIDHGIEAAELRRARDKAVRGRVEVSIHQTESSVTVEVTDDGGGIDFERLRDVLAPRVPNASSLTVEDLVPYLFEQGVTTSGQVTSISGRGVGLDVVAREVGATGGQTRIESKPGQGTRVILHLPATLRGELAVPVVHGQGHYAVPSRAVLSVVRLESIEHTADSAWMRVSTDEGSQLIRVFSLGALLGRPDKPKVGEAALILYYSSGLFAVTVEGYDNPRPITVQRSEELPLQSPLVRGVSPTPDGGVLLLLDVEALHAAARGVTAGASPERAAGVRGPPRALVVEDAPVARELLCGILRSLGLKVEEATDGRQGLMLARSDPPDLVLTDIEMPYMDGIEMVTHFRASPRLSRVPIIVLTTAANEQNRARFEPLGVAGILSKQKFVESELRQLIQQCLQRTE
ncbi:MAG: response regulator [Polyangiaceae bacterium]|nr:response regulator [Polyangiaceae bacterium]